MPHPNQPSARQPDRGSGQGACHWSLLQVRRRALLRLQQQRVPLQLARHQALGEPVGCSGGSGGLRQGRRGLQQARRALRRRTQRTSWSRQGGWRLLQRSAARGGVRARDGRRRRRAYRRREAVRIVLHWLRMHELWSGHQGHVRRQRRGARRRRLALSHRDKCQLFTLPAAESWLITTRVGAHVRAGARARTRCCRLGGTHLGEQNFVRRCRGGTGHAIGAVFVVVGG